MVLVARSSASAAQSVIRKTETSRHCEYIINCISILELNFRYAFTLAPARSLTGMVMAPAELGLGVLRSMSTFHGVRLKCFEGSSAGYIHMNIKEPLR